MQTLLTAGFVQEILVHLLMLGITSFTSASATKNDVIKNNVIKNDVVKMRIIAEPLSLAGLAHQLEDDDDDQSSDLTLRMAPSNFSGPEHFRELLGNCFALKKGNFEYKLCPFQNVTQRETAYSAGRNKFHGLLGVWFEWIVEHGTFTGWKFLNGDDCGVKGPRTTTVHFTCGNSNSLTEATEPQQCHYNIIFRLPQACFPDALLVYPTLSADQRLAWDHLEEGKTNGELTQKGYDKQLRAVLASAGILKDEAALSPLAAFEIVTQTEKNNSAEPSTVSEMKEGGASHPQLFTQLAQCQQAYEETLEQLDKAKADCMPSTTLQTSH